MKVKWYEDEYPTVVIEDEFSRKENYSCVAFEFYHPNGDLSKNYVLIRGDEDKDGNLACIPLDKLINILNRGKRRLKQRKT